MDNASLIPPGTVWHPTTDYYDPSRPWLGGWDPVGLRYIPPAGIRPMASSISTSVHLFR